MFYLFPFFETSSDNHTKFLDAMSLELLPSKVFIAEAGVSTESVIFTKENDDIVEISFKDEMQFFFSAESKDLQERIKSYIAHQNAKDLVPSIIFSFVSGTSLAMVNKWFSSLSITLGVFIRSENYRFYLKNIPVDESSLITLDNISRRVGISGILLSAPIEEFIVKARSVGYYQLKKGYVVEPFGDLE